MNAVASLADENFDGRHPYIRPKDAAALILIDRSGSKPKVLVGRRNPNVAFMPGMFVFPGGRVDKSDHLIPLAASIPSALQKDLMKGRPKTSQSRARALAVAAIREACEETGLCLGRASSTPAELGGAKPGDPKLGGVWKPFSENGLLPDLSGLHLIARAITPPGQVRRFDTRFFVADAAAITLSVPGIVHPNAELVELVWVEIGSSPLADMHAITRAVLRELEQRLATGPLRHDAPIAFFHYHRDALRVDTLAPDA
jgi:8-oxo-dGTP pyrophosphatase MutT (NUDIX family)